MAPIFLACTSAIEDKRKVENVVSSNHPNDDSELTLLMRQLYSSTDSIKGAIIAEEDVDIENFIASLEAAHHAIPSDPKISNQIFTTFNNSIIVEAQKLQVSTEPRVEGYNSLVNRCIDCHKTFCPGPITKIKKLKI